MEKKKEIISCINWAKYLAFIAATVCVLVFQFIGASICITLALSLYVVAFLMLFASLVIQTVELFKADDLVKEKNADAEIGKLAEKELEEGGLNGQSVEVVHLKREKVTSIIWCVLTGLFAIFTFVVLVLF